MLRIVGFIVLSLLVLPLWSQNNNEESLQEIKSNKKTQEKSSRTKSSASGKSFSNSSTERVDAETKSEMANKSSDFYYQRFISAGYESYSPSDLSTAYSLSSNRRELLDEMVGDAEIRQLKTVKLEYLKKIKESGKYSGFKYEYSKNLLKSVSSGGVLICNGEVDTYPIWVLQEVEGYRKDVKIINLKLIQNDAYWNVLKKQYGLSGENASSKTEFIKNLSKKNPNKGIFLSLTNEHSVIKKMSSQLYLTGLAFKVSNVAAEETSKLKANWEKFDVSKVKSKNHSSEDRKLGNNYLLMLSKLYLLQKNKQSSDAKALKNLAKLIAERNGIWSKVEPKFK